MHPEITPVKQVSGVQQREAAMRRMIQIAEIMLAMGVGMGAVAGQDSRSKLPALVAIGNETAERLRRQAESLYGEQTQLRRAAQLHEREAAQRNPADPRLVE